jgi:ubiquinone/menaquinone biosynthesis C-methylase UbiE
MADIKTLYSERYAKQDIKHLYAVEFVVRAFLGTYPKLKLDRDEYSGSHILDLGFGDGRNMHLLNNLGFKICGVEIHEEICASIQDKLSRLGIKADLKVGSNAKIPFESDLFHYVLACHSCYYIEEGTTFKENLREIHRVMKKDGLFICSLPMRDTYVLEGAEPVSKGHWKIKHDPYGLRSGTVFRAFESEVDIADEFGSLFTDASIGFCDDFYWGIRQKIWIVVCKKR